MSTPVADLERRALEFMKRMDFGPEAIRINTEILEQSPNQESAGTRLGRCHMEQRQFDEAVEALRSALEKVLSCRNAAALDWVFVGHWLFLDDPDDAKTLSERAKLASAVDDTFRTLYPIWLATYHG